MSELFTPFMLFVYSIAFGIGFIASISGGSGAKVLITTISVGACIFSIATLIFGNAELCINSELSESCSKHRIEQYQWIVTSLIPLLGILTEFCIERFMARHAPQS